MPSLPGSGSLTIADLRQDTLPAALATQQAVAASAAAAALHGQAAPAAAPAPQTAPALDPPQRPITEQAAAPELQKLPSLHTAESTPSIMPFGSAFLRDLQSGALRFGSIGDTQPAETQATPPETKDAASAHGLAQSLPVPPPLAIDSSATAAGGSHCGAGERLTASVPVPDPLPYDTAVLGTSDRHTPSASGQVSLSVTPPPEMKSEVEPSAIGQVCLTCAWLTYACWDSRHQWLPVSCQFRHHSLMVSSHLLPVPAKPQHRVVYVPGNSKRCPG
jgi:hypothetical protein